jgi:coenzyme F420-reducing hydrogenase alpha subunit
MVRIQKLTAKDKQNLSYNAEYYLSMARLLYEAMKGFGTDENRIRYVFAQMNNDADLKALYFAFNQVLDEKGEPIASGDLISWLDKEQEKNEFDLYLRMLDTLRTD